MKKNLLMIVWLMIVGSVAIFFIFQHKSDARKKNLNQPAPLFETKNLSGEPFALKNIIGKKIILVNFWATYCPPCRDEMPLLNQLHKTLDPEKFVIISVIEDTEQGDELVKLVTAFKKKIPFDFAVYQDPNGFIASLYGTYQIPETFLIGLDGKIIDVLQGAMTSFEKEQIIKKVNQLMLK